MRALVLSAALLLAGCGGSNPLAQLGLYAEAAPAEARCDFRKVTVATPFQCIDLRLGTAQSIRELSEFCAAFAFPGVFTTGAVCDSNARIGGCQSVGLDGAKRTSWYYQGGRFADEAAVKRDCDTRQTFVSSTEK